MTNQLNSTQLQTLLLGTHSVLVINHTSSYILQRSYCKFYDCYWLVVGGGGVVFLLLDIVVADVDPDPVGVCLTEVPWFEFTLCDVSSCSVFVVVVVTAALVLASVVSSSSSSIVT